MGFIPLIYAVRICHVNHFYIDRGSRCEVLATVGAASVMLCVPEWLQSSWLIGSLMMEGAILSSNKSI